MMIWTEVAHLWSWHHLVLVQLLATQNECFNFSFLAIFVASGIMYIIVTIISKFLFGPSVRALIQSLGVE
jgi:hypothetical protein